VRITGEMRRVDLFGFTFPVVQAISASGKTDVTSSGPAINAHAADAWVPFELKLTVPANAQYIEAGIESAGLGSVEVRNVTIGG
jgi:hypothetical protein